MNIEISPPFVDERLHLFASPAATVFDDGNNDIDSIFHSTQTVADNDNSIFFPQKASEAIMYYLSNDNDDVVLSDVGELDKTAATSYSYRMLFISFLIRAKS